MKRWHFTFIFFFPFKSNLPFSLLNLCRPVRSVIWRKDYCFIALHWFSVLLCVHLPQTSWLQMHNTKGCVFLPHIDFFSWSIDLASLILITNQTENRTLFQWLIALCDTSPDFPSKSDGAFILDAAKNNNSPNPPSLAEDVFSPSEESCGRLNVPSYLLSSQATLAAINEAGQ